MTDILIWWARPNNMLNVCMYIHQYVQKTQISRRLLDGEVNSSVPSPPLPMELVAATVNV